MRKSPVREPYFRFELPKDKPLSPRMKEVLDLMSYGLYYWQIGEQLNISEQTAKNYGRQITERLRAVNRAHAIRLGFEQGYLERRNI